MVFCIKLYATAYNSEPDGPPDPVLVRDVVVSKDSVRRLLINLDTDVPGVVTVNFVELSDGHAVDTDLSQSWSDIWRMTLPS